VKQRLFKPKRAPVDNSQSLPVAAMPQGRPPHGEPELRCRETSAGLIHTFSRYPRAFKTSLNLPVLKIH
jgi:hypothetical protein